MRLAWGLSVALLMAACSLGDGPVAIWTRPPSDTCLQARVGGTLVADPQSGLAFRGIDGAPNVPIWWPHGWTARREHGVVLLVSPAGKVVAREGDRILASGGHGSDPNGGHVSDSVQCDIQVNPGPDAWTPAPWFM